MSEGSLNSEHQSKGWFRALKEQYSPHRQQAGEILKSVGLEPDTSIFKKARYKFGRALLKKQEEGEIDSVTGLLNRNGFERRLREEAERAKRHGHKTTVIYLDANNLKLINDTKGHEAGNKLIEDVGLAIRNSTRTIDVGARIGGDEFAIVLPETEIEGADTLWTERLEPSFTQGGISIAAGAAYLDPDAVKESMDRADKMLYQAKTLSKKEHKNIMLTDKR